VWVEKYERGGFDAETEAANLLEQYESRIAALERMVGRLALENGLLKKASEAFRPRTMYGRARLGTDKQDSRIG
jgi:transposase